MADTMRALALTDNGPELLTDYPIAQPRQGEALIRLRLAGVCSTDLELISGYKGGYRGVLGHEFVGEVVSAPDDPGWEGRRVVGEINIGCGSCLLCLGGLAKHCRRRQSLGIIGRDGAFADYLTLPIANLHEVPAALSDEAAVFVEPLAAALEILEQVHITPQSHVFVLGDGRLGQLIAQVLLLTGCRLTLIGKHRDKLGLLAGRRALQTCMATAELLDELSAQPADVVVEATGSKTGFAAARRLVRPAGTLVLKSTYAGAYPEVDLSALVVDEVTMVGSRCGPFAPALRLLSGQLVDVLPLVSGHFDLHSGLEALSFAGQTGVLKVLIHAQ